MIYRIYINVLHVLSRGHVAEYYTFKTNVPAWDHTDGCPRCDVEICAKCGDVFTNLHPRGVKGTILAHLGVAALSQPNQRLKDIGCLENIIGAPNSAHNQGAVLPGGGTTH